MQGRVRSALALAVAAAAGVAMAQEKCNGHAELCGRRYSEVSFAAAHDAPFVGNTLFHTQFTYPENAFTQGIRYFTTQVHDKNGGIEQCHTSCALLDVGPFHEILTSIKNKLDANPREVATLLVTSHLENGDILERFRKEFEDTGTDKLAFAPNGDLAFDQWPTLGELIDSGKRLVVFLDYGADARKVPYILDEFKYYFETPFSPTKDNFYQCDVHRPSANTDPNGRMIFMNHNLNIKLFEGLLIPAPSDAEKTNSVDDIFKQSDICQENHGRAPNVVMLDYVSEGQAIEAQDILNGFAERKQAATDQGKKNLPFAQMPTDLTPLVQLLQSGTYPNGTKLSI